LDSDPGLESPEDIRVHLQGLAPKLQHARLEIAVGLYQGKRDEIVGQIHEQLAELSRPSDEGADQVRTGPDAEPEQMPQPVGAPVPANDPPPMWAADPSGQHRLRWSDGHRWTDQTSE
jgi:hypothetical protein